MAVLEIKHGIGQAPLMKNGLLGCVPENAGSGPAVARKVAVSKCLLVTRFIEASSFACGPVVNVALSRRFRAAEMGCDFASP